MKRTKTSSSFKPSNYSIETLKKMRQAIDDVINESAPAQQIEEFTKDNLNFLRRDLNALLAPLNDKYGLKCSIGNIRFDKKEFRTPLGVKIVGGKSEEELEKEDFAQHCRWHGFNANDYGRQFTSGFSTYRLVGIKPRSRKYPIIAEQISTGKRFKFSQDAITLNSL